MGQRLNLEIHGKNGLLANAYYHWSGFTSTSCEMALRVIRYLEIHPLGEQDPLMHTIEALAHTGARLNPDEKIYIEKYTTLKVNSSLFEGVDRNDGLIGVSPAAVTTTRDWEEARIEIYPDRALVYPRNVLRKPDLERYPEEYQDIDWVESSITADDLEWISFERFKEVCAFFAEHLEQKEYCLDISGVKYLMIA